ncbi:hypothetical protein IJV57_04465 [Candidatus Saccharibacteria bacterium]|nr:hypothetical protein [Candidatus Saccharibacteria bacterium]
MKKLRRGFLITIKLCLLVYAILTGIRCLVDPGYSKYGGFLAGLFLPFIPNIVEKVFKCKFAFRIELLYYAFIFVALDMGICMDLYKTVPYFDKTVHFCSGVFSALVGHYALVYFKVNKSPKLFKVMFIMFFSIAIAVLWEFFEFGCDKLLGQSMQQLISVGVDDTMFDLICATIGAGLGGYLLTIPNFIEYLEEL